MGRFSDFNQNRMNYSIMDIQGKIVIKGNIESADNGIYSLSTSSLFPGIYLVRFEGKDGRSYNERVIIRVG